MPKPTTIIVKITHFKYSKEKEGRNSKQIMSCFSGNFEKHTFPKANREFVCNSVKEVLFLIEHTMINNCP